jgi:geranylgeranyl diphosphate synthase type I
MQRKIMEDQVPSLATHPLDTEHLRTRVQSTLDGFLARRATDLATVSPDCGALGGAVTALVRGGKRFRAGFLYWGWRGAGGADDDRAVAAATALELFQAAALIHDDVMDGSDSRRGMPSMHRAFEARHRGQGWSGPPERFGQAAAILTGDLCQAWADELFQGCGLPAAALARGRTSFDRMRTHLMAGQYLDVLAQVVAEPDPERAEARARHLIQFKSARYSVVEPLLIGAELAGAEADLLGAFAEFGAALGEAFQLRDDILGVFGDPVATGKPAGDDLREGKRTVLVARTLRLAAPAEATRVLAGLGQGNLGAPEVEAIRAIMIGSGALAAVETLIDELTVTARAALTDVPARGLLCAPADEVLDSMVDLLTNRPA